MCDYCGCRRSGPTAELAAEHERLLSLGEELDAVLDTPADSATDTPAGDVARHTAAVFAEFVDLLEMHAAKEEIGLFPAAKETMPLGPEVDQFCREHQDLHRWLADGPRGERVPDALRLLITHIEDEEHDLFPHVFHEFDPEQWDEIELAHRAIEAVWNEPAPPAGESG